MYYNSGIDTMLKKIPLTYYTDIDLGLIVLLISYWKNVNLLFTINPFSGLLSLLFPILHYFIYKYPQF